MWRLQLILYDGCRLVLPYHAVQHAAQTSTLYLCASLCFQDILFEWAFTLSAGVTEDDGQVNCTVIDFTVTL